MKAKKQLPPIRNIPYVYGNTVTDKDVVGGVVSIDVYWLGKMRDVKMIEHPTPVSVVSIDPRIKKPKGFTKDKARRDACAKACKYIKTGIK